MAVISTPYGGMSVRTVRAGDIVLSRGGGGGSSFAPPPAPVYKDVRISGSTVFINGQGFSVSPAEQADFIKDKTNSLGSSAQLAITEAEKRAEELMEQARITEEARRAEEAKPIADELGLGTSIVSAYPLRERATDWAKAKVSYLAEALPYARLTKERGYGASQIAPPTLIEKEVVPTGKLITRGTIQVGVPTVQELKGLEFYEKAARIELSTEQIIIQSNLDLKANKVSEDIAASLRGKGQNWVENKSTLLQQKVNDGKISQSEAQKQLDSFINKINTNISKEFDRKFHTAMQPHISKTSEEFKLKASSIETQLKKDIDKRQLGLKFTGAVLTGVGYGLISLAAPPMGVALAGLGAAETLKFTKPLPFGLVGFGIKKEVVEFAKQKPYTFGSNIGGMLIGGAGVGVARGLRLRLVTKSDLSKQISQLPKNQRIAFKNYWSEITKLEKRAGFVPVRKITFEGLRRLPSKSHSSTIKFIRQKGDVLGGSQAMRSMLHGKSKAPLSRWIESDVDVYTKGNIMTRANSLANIYKDLGIERVSVVPNTGRITIGGIKVVEFHSLNMLYGNLRQVAPSWQPLRLSIRRSPTGVKVAPILGMQGRRLLIRSYLDEKMGVGTSKYLSDFRRIENSLVQDALTKQRMVLPKGKVYRPDFDKIIRIKKPLPPVTKLPKIYKPKVYKPFVYPKYPTYPTYPVVPFLMGYPKYPPTKLKPYPSITYPPPISPFLPKLIKKPLYKTPAYKAPPISPFLLGITPAPKKIISKVPKYPKPLVSLRFVPTIFKKKVRVKTPRKISRVESLAKELKKLRKPQQGYYVYGKPIRQKKYVKLSKVPLIKSEAHSLGLYLADTSLSRTFKIKKTTKKPQKSKLEVPIGYSLFSQHKFRDYRVQKGRRVPLKSKWIERSPFLLDTRQEVNKIGLLKRLAQIRKRSQQVNSYKQKKPKTNNYLRNVQNVFSMPTKKKYKRKKRIVRGRK